MKLITNILNNYYSQQLINYIQDEINIKYMLDVKNERYGNDVYIMVKPKHYINYTNFLHFKKNNSLNCLISLKTTETEYIDEKIANIEKYDLWHK